MNTSLYGDTNYGDFGSFDTGGSSGGDDMVGSLIGGIFEEIGDNLMYAGEMEINKRRYREQIEREDTAVQRRVADLKAAGLSPTLAAGSAAQSSVPITASSQKGSQSGLQSTIINAALAKKSIEKTDAEIARVNKLREMDDYSLNFAKGKELPIGQVSEVDKIISGITSALDKIGQARNQGTGSPALDAVLPVAAHVVDVTKDPGAHALPNQVEFINQREADKEENKKKDDETVTQWLRRLWNKNILRRTD